MIMQYKRFSFGNDHCEFKFGHDDVHVELEMTVKPMEYVSCAYDGYWWIGIVVECDDNEKDRKIKFFHPHGPCKQFSWPQTDDVCWIPNNNIICKVNTPTTTSGRLYSITGMELNEIEMKWSQIIDK